MIVPKRLHQIWKDSRIPARFAGFRDSWLKHHPDWDYKLWTDDDVLFFIRKAYPDFLPLYLGYAKPVSRADAARYLILKHFGGLYVDLDFECFQSLDALVGDHPLSIGVEPASHVQLEAPRQRGLEKILCPSLIASKPGHSFWDTVVDWLRQARNEPDVLDATGPFLLTCAHGAYTGPEAINLLPPETIYPADKFDCWEGRLFDIAYWERVTRNTYALHHWDGGWFRGDAVARSGIPGKWKASTTGPKAAPNQTPGSATTNPLVSCLMATRNRFEQAVLSIECFRRQTYDNRELVIIDDSRDDRLTPVVSGDPRIRLIRPNDPNPVLGRARNLAVQAARGTHICQWDDDDLYDPLRIAVQMAALRNSGASACLLSRWMIWWPESDRLAVSRRRPWEGSLLCEKAALIPYPELSRGEDTPVIEALLRNARVVHLDAPRLYLYVAHGRNTFATDHFEEHWAAAENRFTDNRFDAVAGELDKRLPFAAYKATFAQTEESRRPGSEAVSGLVPTGQSSAIPATNLSRVRRSRQGLSPGRAERDAPLGVNLYGHLNAPTGLGIAGQGTATALAATNLPHHPIDLYGRPGDSAAAAYPINILHTNPDVLLNGRFWHPRGPISPDALSDRYNIGYWAWESATTFPESWRQTFHLFDEIWVPSQFAARTLEPVVRLPVTVIPHAVKAEEPSIGREQLGLPQDGYFFAFLFDELSGFDRKNPIGVINAFRKAFPNHEAGLVLKARSLSSERRLQLEAAAQGCPSIKLIVGDISRRAALSVIAACDAYVSLHRAEGFGLTIAEAMGLGKPVIATAYSGVLDFMTPETGFPVGFALVETDRATGYYPEGTVWAEPDLEEAAHLMRQVYDDRVLARKVGERAAERIRSLLSPEAVGAKIRQRLTAIIEDRPQGQTTPMIKIAADHGTEEEPSVLILTPVKNARAHLPAYLHAVRNLDYPKSKLSLAVLESDSTDCSFEFLEDQFAFLRRELRTASLFRKNFGLYLDQPRWKPELQNIRRATIARARNWLLSSALRDEEWVLWIDADVIDFPPDSLRRLLEVRRDIVVPHCVLDKGGPTFDLNTFQSIQDEAAGQGGYLIDGLYQPPRGVGRRYLEDYRGQTLVEVDSVGGAMLLVRSELHRQGLVFPPVSFRGYIETEAFAMMAKDMGLSCWGMPDLEIIHARA